MTIQPDIGFDVTDTGIVGDMGVALARLRCGQMGHLFRDQPTHDRGIDAEIELAEGTIATGRILKAQVKCGASYFSRFNESHFIVPVDHKHYEHWKKHSVPVVFLLANHSTDECYWELVNDQSIQSTGKNFVIKVPRSNLFDRHARNAISRLATPSVAPQSFSVFDVQDTSTGLARRLAYYVALEPNPNGWQKADVEQTIRQVTADARTSRHFRDQTSEQLWRGISPSVVWVYVYSDKTHKDLGRYLARAVWIDPLLNEDFRPLRFGVAQDPAGLQIDWNENHERLLEELKRDAETGADYVRELERIFPDLQQLAFEYWRFILGGKGGTYFDAAKLVREFTPAIQSIDSLPTPPAPCKRISKQVDAVRQELIRARTKAQEGSGSEATGDRHSEIFHHAQNAFFKCLIVRHEIDERDFS